MAHTGAMESERMMAEMRSHLQAMTGAGVAADSLRRLMPMHRRMAANMLQQMNAEMRGMNMQGDSGWSALVDSIRRDLTRMPELTPRELPAFMAAHQARLGRLMEQHASMMGSMH
jgi:hypothetical protein